MSCNIIDFDLLLFSLSFYQSASGSLYYIIIHVQLDCSDLISQSIGNCFVHKDKNTCTSMYYVVYLLILYIVFLDTIKYVKTI